MEQSIKNQSIKADTDSRLLIGPNESVSPFKPHYLGFNTY